MFLPLWQEGDDKMAGLMGTLAIWVNGCCLYMLPNVETTGDLIVGSCVFFGDTMKGILSGGKG